MLGTMIAGCSIRKLAIRKLGDALAESGTTYASDNDPVLVRDALPFALKLIESLLEQSPRHSGLLLAATGGFTQYAYAYVQQDADEQEDRDLQAAAALRARARGLYLRARGYGLRGLEIAHRDFQRSLTTDPAAAVKVATREDVPLLYWTAASWGAAISVSKDDPALIADLPAVGALIQRALDLQEDYDHGALHEFLISYEAGRPDVPAGASERARRHFARAMELSGGLRAAPLVALAEAVSVRNQDRVEFLELLRRALGIDPDAMPEWRLANLVMQKRARWLLGRVDLLFAE
jgi:predicted anti-sigma-YlaC factor YlaD